jgi:histidine triad (HIT) family protein
LSAENYFVADCLFCKIAAGQIPSKAVYQDEEVLAFQDIQPQAPHHVLIIPRRHVANSLSDLKNADEQILLRLFDAARRIAGELGIEESGYRLVSNSGPEAGQSVFHMHFHLLGGAPLGLFGTPGRASAHE